MDQGVKDPFAWIAPRLAELKEAGLDRGLRVFEAANLPENVVDGRPVVQFSSNNYLGLATHPRVLRAAEEALKRYGAGSGASRLISGTQTPHYHLENSIAKFKGAEGALVYGAGILANLGLLPCLASDKDIILLDKSVHASLYDGARLSGAEVRRFPHGDLARLEDTLKQVAGLAGRRVLVVVEAVYSMDGDILPLPSLLALSEKYGAMLVVDEAHSTGVLGSGGKGILEHFSLPWHPNLVLVGTLSKALGTLGGFVAGPADLVSWLKNSSRSFIFATALPGLCAAAADEALSVIQDEPERVARLWKNRHILANGLAALGWDLGRSATPILPIAVGSAAQAVSLQQHLWDLGYYVPAIRPPTVPAGACRLRITVTSEHREDHITGLLGALGGKP